MRVGFTFGESVAARMQAPFNDPTIWNFAIPFAAAALLVAMLVDTQLAFLTGIINALRSEAHKQSAASSDARQELRR